LSPPLYLSKAQSWYSGPLLPIEIDEWAQVVCNTVDLTMDVYRQTLSDQGGREFSFLMLSPAYLESESDIKNRSFLSLTHGNVVAISPTPVLVRSMYRLATRHGYRLLDSEDRPLDLSDAISYRLIRKQVDLSDSIWRLEGTRIEEVYCPRFHYLNEA
jgi:hypothetical protein